MKPQGIFTKQLWLQVQSIYDDIIHTDFVQQLTNGTLSHQYFQHYLQQDILYIKDDAEAFAIVAGKAADSKEKNFFKFLSEDGIEMEKVLHDEFLAYFEIEKAKRKSPICKSYTDFLLDKANNAEYAVALCALLPCFWIYSRVGEYILGNTIENNPYKKWINTYSGEEYKEYTTRFIQIVEKEAQNADLSTQNKMTNAFMQASKFELDFFEEGKFC